MSNAESAAAAPAIAKPAPLPYPRQCDRILQSTDSLFVFASALGVAALIVWASFTYLDTVTRGAGKVVPQQQNQTVQHFEGGIVADILVKEGDRVEKGAVILRVQNSFSKSELLQTRIEITAREMKLVRLAAESTGQPLLFPKNLGTAAQSFAERESTFYESRRKTLDEQIAILNDQYNQKQLELSELQARYANTKRERELVMQRVNSLRRLASLGAVSANELIDNERGLQQVEARMSDLTHEIPRTESAVSELSRRRSEAALRFAGDAEKERGDVQLQLAKLQESAAALTDRNERDDILAPVSGTVNKLMVSTIGGVVKSGEPLAIIVPTDSAIAVEAKVSPQDRARVWPGQDAVIKISAYDFSTYGGLKGRVTEVSPDALQDERGTPYFRVLLEADGSSFGHDKPVVPGMTADVDILSGKRTIMESLLRPLHQLKENALRQ